MTVCGGAVTVAWRCSVGSVLVLVLELGLVLVLVLVLVWVLVCKCESVFTEARIGR